MIKKLLVFLALIVFLHPTDAKAQESCETIPCPCTSFEVGPREGSSATPFTLHGIRCGNPDGSGNFIVRFFNDSGQLLDAQGPFFHPDPGEFVQSLTGPQEPGTYSVRLYLLAYGNDVLGQGSITITSTEALECGDIAPENDTERCPAECSPAAMRGERNLWWCPCGDLGQVVCPPGNYFGDPPCRYPLGPVDGICLPMETISGDFACDDGQSIRSAIGCIPVLSLQRFIEFWLRWAFGISGGISFLLIVYATFLFMTSRTNEEQLKKSREIFFSAITGIILLIFAIFVFRLFGVDILRLPGFS